MTIPVDTIPAGFWTIKPGLFEGCHSEAIQHDSDYGSRHGATLGNVCRDRTEVSRGHSSVPAQEGARCAKGRTRQYREER